MKKTEKIRIDLFLFQEKFVETREKARALIMAGKVLVNSTLVDKPGTKISTDSNILIKGNLPFVSRGGLKLQEAVEKLNLDLKGKVCLDVGASTGGFTDCMLQNGAERVFAVDVGYGQLAWKIRQDKRVVVIERTNIRKLTEDQIPCPVDLVTIDVSFISLKIVIPCVVGFMKNPGMILALIKPQFEVGKGMVGKGGVVRDHKLHEKVIKDVSEFAAGIGLSPGKVIPSPILGPKGNREFIIQLFLP